MQYDINIKKVRKIQDAIWGNIKQTFSYKKGYGKPLEIFGHYGGVFEAGEEKLVMHTDGVGTKLLIAEKMKKYDTVGIDAIAMSVNDILCLGAEPIAGVDYIALRKEDPEMIEQIVKGLVKGAHECNCPIIGGETAIVKDILQEGAFDLTFTVIGRVKKLILGNDITEGMVLIGLESSGLHSNGYTLARKILSIEEWGNELLEPTKIYVKPVLEIIEKIGVFGIAHITGGSFSKLTRLNKGVEFEIEFEKMPQTKLYLEIEKKIPEVVERYRTFNMGIGMVLVANKQDVAAIQKIAEKYKIKSYVIGKTKKGKGVYLEKEGERIKLSYEDSGI
ncbi:MAG: phosphoribosylformylglycinamidine cyclo-ligase [Candidatus Micrarchaeia archaeon]